MFSVAHYPTGDTNSFYAPGAVYDVSFNGQSVVYTTSAAPNGGVNVQTATSARRGDSVVLKYTEPTPLNSDVIFESCPNLVFTDVTIGTTLTLAAFATVPGYWMKERTRLLVTALLDAAGNDGKEVQFRAGPANGTFATATQFGGQLGLTTQRYVGLQAMLWSDNSRQVQRAVPIGQNNWVGTNGSNGSATLAIDTTLDWNIYVGVKFAVAGGSPTNSWTLRNFSVMSPLR